MKITLKKIYLLVAGVLNLFIAQAQVSNAENMMKYWNYRYDLIGDDIDPNYEFWAPGFLDLTLNQGGSMPASVQIYNTWDADTHNGSYDPFNFDENRPGACANQDVWHTFLDKVGLLSWGDAQIEFGKYMMILASEWKLLKANGESTEQVENEIYLAVKAAIRLDYNAEIKFGKPQQYDGFFSRDDVPQDFAFDETRFGNRFHWVTSDWSCDLQHHESECDDISSPTYYGTYTNSYGTFNRFTATEPSIDQILYYLTGLYYIARLVPTGLQYSPDPDIVNEAKEQIGKTIDYLCLHGWFVINPSGNIVCRGPMSHVYMYVFSKMLLDLGIIGQHPCILLNPVALSTSQLVWTFLTQYYNFSGWNGPNVSGNLWSHRMNLYMLMIDGAYASDAQILASNIADIVQNIIRVSLWGPIAALPPRHLGVTRRSLARWGMKLNNMQGSVPDATLSGDFDDLSWVDAGRSVLQNETPYQSKSYYEQRMGLSVYECLGRKPFLSRDPGWDPNWEPRKKVKIAFDYMLMNNFSRISFPQYTFNYWSMGNGHYGSYDNSLKRKVTATYPIGNFGNQQHELNVQAAYTMVNTAKLNANSRVNFIAPHITLEPGFYAQNGSTSLIFNDRMRCERLYNDGSNYGEKTAPDESYNEEYELSEKDSLLIAKWLKETDEKYFKDTDDPAVAADRYVKDLMADPDQWNKVLASLDLPAVKSTLFLELAPNPTSSSTYASFKMFSAGKVWMTLVDNMGITKRIIADGIDLPKGVYGYNIETDDLVPGMYSVVLRTENQQESKILIVQK